MGIYGRIKSLADNQKMSIREVESKLNFSNGTLRRWNNSVPGVDKVQTVADFFHVSTDYLLGRTDTADVVNKDYPSHIDVEDIVNNSAILTSRDHALSDEDKSAIRALLTTYLDSSEGQRRLKKYGASEINGENEE